MNDPGFDADLQLALKLRDEALAPIKRAFVGKGEAVDLMGVSLVAGENLFLHGPPGTAKSALVQELARAIDGRAFDYLLTRFTEPNELFGPFDIRKLREGELISNTEGMLPEADLAFLDELFNANSAILNGLLTVLNERVFRRGRETRRLPTLMVVGASNRLPEDETLGALFDRFLLRVRCDNVPPELLADVLDAGWQLDMRGAERPAPSLHADDVRRLTRRLVQVDLSQVRPAYLALIERIRQAGHPVSDRRAVKLQRPVAASALMCGRSVADATDLWVLRYIWDAEEQQEVLATLVTEAIDRARPDDDSRAHPRSRGPDAPDPEALARDLERLAERLAAPSLTATQKSALADRLGLLAGRCEWVAGEQQRTFLAGKVRELFATLESKS